MHDASNDTGNPIPKFTTIHQMVDLKGEIEGSLRRMAPDLNHRFLYRVISFALSGTCLVDMRCDTEDADCTREAKIACKLKAQQLTKLMNHAVMSRRKSEEASSSHYRSGHEPTKICLSDSFQELMYIQFMNLNVSYEIAIHFHCQNCLFINTHLIA